MTTRKQYRARCGALTIVLAALRRNYRRETRRVASRRVSRASIIFEFRGPRLH